MRRYGTLLLIAALLAACATPITRGPAQLPARHQIERFSFDGVAIARQGDRGWRVGVSWQHEPERDEILLSGPLGQSVARIVRDGLRGEVVTGERKQYRGENADVLVAELLGLPLPVAALPRWLLGQAVSTRRDPLGRPLQVRDQGWQVEYTEYVSDDANALPARLILHRDDTPDLELTLRIDQWDLP